MCARLVIVLVGFSCILGLPCGLAGRIGSAATPQPLTLAVEERMLAAPGPDAIPPIAISVAGDRVAWRIQRGQHWIMMVNGEPYSEPGDRLGEPLFSHDGKHLGFSVLREGKERLVVDGAERGEVPGLRTWLWAPDNESIAWASCRPAATGELCSVQLLGGPAGPEYPVIASMIVSSGTPPRLAFDARDHRRWMMVVNGQAYTAVTFMKDPVPPPYAGFTFSPDGRRFAYMSQGVGIQPVVDGKADLTLTRLAGTPRFSADSRRVAYAVVDFKGTSGFLDTPEFRGRIYVDGKEVAAADSKKPRQVHNPRFRQDGFPIALDGLDPAWAGVSDPVFSPDGQRVAWAIRTGDKAYRASVDGSFLGPTVERFLAGPAFTPDSRKVAYVGRLVDETIVVVDGAILSRLPARGNEIAENLLFSPDGEHLAFVLGRADTSYWNRTPTDAEPRLPRRVVLDGVPGPEFDATPIPRLLFSTDSRHLAYIAYVGTFGDRGAASVTVLDGHVSASFAVSPRDPTTVLFWDTLRFTAPSSVACVARKESKYFSVTFSSR